MNQVVVETKALTKAKRPKVKDRVVPTKSPERPYAGRLGAKLNQLEEELGTLRALIAELSKVLSPVMVALPARPGTDADDSLDEGEASPVEILIDRFSREIVCARDDVKDLLNALGV